MGESERYQEYKNVKFKKRFAFFRDGNALVALIILNSVFFLTLYFIKVGFFYGGANAESFNEQILAWFSLPDNFTGFSEKPWTLLSYMFSENSPFLLRLLSNMFWLWAFGHMMQELGGNDKIIPVYLYGGITGAFLFMLASSLFPVLMPSGNGALLGANASVMAVAAATTALDPDYRFYRHLRNGIPVWVLLVLYAIIDLLGTGGFNAFTLAHIGGGLAGFLFVLLLRKGKDGSLWMNKLYRQANELFTPSNKKKKGARETLFYESGKRTPFEKHPNITQQRVDEILDKINQHGYSFLTEEEKEILRKAAEEDL